MNIDEILERVKEIWDDKIPPEKRKITIGTGKGGAILHKKWMHEEFVGPWNDELQRQAEEEYEEGYYETGTFGVEYKGFPTDKEDGFYAVKINDKRWETWYVKNNWVSANNVNQISEEVFNELLKDNQ